MPDDKKKPEPKLASDQIPAEHAVVPVPFGVMQAITNYLVTKPYNEVNQFIGALSQIKTADRRKLEEPKEQ
jgi:hypothetical protein